MARPSMLLMAALCALAGVACQTARSAATDAGPDAGLPDAGSTSLGPGAHWTDGGATLVFEVRSARATRIELSVFARALGAPAAATFGMTASQDRWQVAIPAAELAAAGVGSTVYYGFRAWGPNWTYDSAWSPGSSAGFAADVDAQGNRFNPNKLLIDPYARELSHDPYQPGMADSSVYDVGPADRNKDSASSAAKSIVVSDPGVDAGQHPAWGIADDVIYEVHLRGLTQGDPDAGCPGTYRAAADRAPYLKALGVTAVEFLPVQETQNDTNTDQAPGNYWGYSTLAFFAPDRRYACDRTPGGPTREFAQMVAAFHDQGLKVLLDVVYNHTAETGGGAVFSWVGLDNASYYELDAAGTGYYDNTGLGGNVNVANPIVRDLVLDSLKAWVGLGVDGFRFDLAAVLGNACAKGCYRFDAADPANVLNRAVHELPGTVLIAEPWGIGAGTYQLTGFPTGWSSWNDQFRDRLRNSQNKLGFSAPTMRALGNQLNGSPDLFNTAGRGPPASINYLVSHDGFTLNDLFSCNAADNAQAWPYGPSGGGTTNNLSWDHGGDAVAQAQAVRTGLALLMTAAGTPMMTGGDEFARTVHCNNNPYNLDSVGNWLAWPSAAAHADEVTFLARLLAFRGAHPALRPAQFRAPSALAWLDASGAVASSGYLDDPNATFLAVRILSTPPGESARSLLVAYNEGSQAVTFILPSASSGAQWYLAADTSSTPAVPGFMAVPGTESPWTSATFPMDARAVVMFVER